MTVADASLETFAGVGGVPALVARWDLAATLTLDSETHIGAANEFDDPDAAVDQPVDRDPATGLPRLRFTTLTGLLDTYMTDRLAGYEDRYASQREGDPEHDPDPWIAKWRHLMGSTAGASVIDGWDVTFEPAHEDMPTTLVRTHNRVNPQTGTAATGALWSTEVLTVGSHGLLLLHLNVPGATSDDDGKRTEPPVSEDDLLALIAAAGQGLTAAPGTGRSGVRLGASTRIGSGRCRADHWVAVRHDLTTPAGFAAAIHPSWVELRRELADATNASRHAAARDAIEAARGSVLARGEVPDRRVHDTLDLTVSVGVPGDRPGEVLPGLLLVADQPRPGMEEVEAAHRTVPHVDSTDGDQPGAVMWDPVLGVAGLHATLRAHALRIARHLAGADPKGRAEATVAHWFGAPPDANEAAGGPRPGRIHLADAFVRGGGLVHRHRIAIDPVFLDPIDGSLFDEEAQAGGSTTIRLEIRNPTETIRGLLAYMVRDLTDWCPLTLGGHGHGHVTVTEAILTTIDDSDDSDDSDGTEGGVERVCDLTRPRDHRDVLAGWCEKLADELTPQVPE